MFKISLSMFAIVHFVSGQSIAIPLRFRGNNVPYITGSVPGLFGDSAVVSFELITGSASRIWMTSHENINSLDPDQMTLDVTNIQADSVGGVGGSFIIGPTFSVVSDTGHNVSVDMIRVADFGVGRGSFLLENFHSIEILRNQQLMILNQTDPNLFTATCEPQSQIVIPLRPLSDVANGDFLASINFGTGALVHEFWALVDNRDSEYILHISPYDLRGIYQILHGYLSDRNRVISRCVAARRLLPNISIGVRVSNHPSAGTLGTIVLYPEDYTRLQADGTCTFLIGEGTCRSGAMCINPVMIPNMNVRFTPDSLTICDARVGE